MSTDQQVARAVLRAMEAQSLTQPALAEATGIPYQTLNRRLRGLASFRVDELDAIARTLSCTPADFLAEAVA